MTLRQAAERAADVDTRPGGIMLGVTDALTRRLA
jgi:hypothetical protein